MVFCGVESLCACLRPILGITFYYVFIYNFFIAFRNPDGRLVQIPRAMLKKLIESGQVKTPKPAVVASNTTLSNSTIGEPPPLAPRVSTNDVLNMLPTVPVRQDQLQPRE